MNTCKSTGDLLSSSAAKVRSRWNRSKSPNCLAVGDGCTADGITFSTQQLSLKQDKYASRSTNQTNQAHFNEAAASRQMSSTNKIKSFFSVGKGKGGGGSSTGNLIAHNSTDGASGLDGAGGSGTALSSQQGRMVGAPVTPADVAAVTQATVDSWMQTFDAVLSHKVGLDLFRRFLRSEFSEENIEFWIACENYRQLPDPQVEDMAREIFENFVTELAPKEINLDASTRIACAQLMETPNRDTFAQAQRRIRALMERDSYQRFLQSPTFLDFVKQNNKTIQR